MHIPDGTYRARPTTAAVNESESGALVLYLGVRLEDGQELTSYHTLVNKDGALNTRTIDNLKAWSGWDGVDPFWFVDAELGGIEIEVVIANEEFVGKDGQTRTAAKVKWVNPPGGSGAGMKESGDRRALLAKHGAKFRANAGGAAAGRGQKAEAGGERRTPNAGPGREQRPEGATRTPPAARAAPARSAEAEPSDINACWDEFCKVNAGVAQADLEQAWFALVDEVGGGKGQDQFTPGDWGRVMAEIGNRLPM